jgi:hypothetical protein
LMSSVAHHDGLLRRIEGARAELASHPIYGTLTTPDDLRCFMEHHVFAVWDFMSLLKALQRQLTCPAPPWRPVGAPWMRRFINEIVLEEECDQIEGRAVSHFELYHEAMAEAGASTDAIDRFLALLDQNVDPIAALEQSGAPPGARAFVAKTFEFIASAKPHVICAAFTFGREEPIPRMFRLLVERLAVSRIGFETLRVYFERHIRLDGDKHAPLAVQMVAHLCGDDGQKWAEAAGAAVAAIGARMALWNAASSRLRPPRVDARLSRATL